VADFLDDVLIEVLILLLETDQVTADEAFVVTHNFFEELRDK
jgi:hypothetical protein